MSNCVEVGLTYSAVWRAGGVTTPVLFLLSDDELRHVLSDSEAAYIVTTPEFLPKVQSAAAGVPTLRGIVLAGGAAEGTLSFAELEAAPEGDLVDSRSDRPRRAALHRRHDRAVEGRDAQP